MLGQFKSIIAVMLVLMTTGVFAQTATVDAEIGATEAYELVKDGKITLIDIRRPEEWRQTGVAQGALRINMLHPKGFQGFAQEIYTAVGGDLNAPIVLICRTGSRTSRLQPILTQVGFTNVKHVPEGTLGNRKKPGWIAQGLPIEPCKDC
ncbi:rhodanese-like domain-containing protein [Orrella daihaiensis]|uniref:Rhodanese-like domain-containing protein n=1 Tax=Orrella daihaiensis TaxID=2782176 RepID=A0ABY4ALH5_9BURK|nr:rhodanese-like domain-containing protein [Orrella daihaiensis]UOD50270.1 rhodanese-like domain-containing protein [Orrella daihaiensis]